MATRKPQVTDKIIKPMATSAPRAIVSCAITLASRRRRPTWSSTRCCAASTTRSTAYVTEGASFTFMPSWVSARMAFLHRHGSPDPWYAEALPYEVIAPGRTPRREAAADVVGIETERIADAEEREEPGAVRARQPRFGLPEQAPPMRGCGLVVLAVHVGGVLQDRPSEALPDRMTGPAP